MNEETGKSFDPRSLTGLRSSVPGVRILGHQVKERGTPEKGQGAHGNQGQPHKSDTKGGDLVKKETEREPTLRK